MNITLFFFFYNLAHQSVFFDKLVVFFALYFPFAVVFLVGLFLLFYHKVLPSQNPIKDFINKWKSFISVIVSSGLAWALAIFLKSLFKIPRPVLSLSDIHPLIEKTTFSFPSEHAMFFSALAFAIFFINQKAGYLLMFLAFLIGVARIIVGVHYPIDVLVGWLIGIGVGLLANKIWKQFT